VRKIGKHWQCRTVIISNQVADITIFTPCAKMPFSDIEAASPQCLLTALAVPVSLSSTKTDY
jgi:hypothetical protein